MPDNVDNKALFSALQSELNSRITIRANVNLVHIQVVSALCGALLLTKAFDGFGNMISISGVISVIIPLVSVYFISLYHHSDIQVGLIGSALKKIEASEGYSASIKYYDKRSQYQIIGDDARNISHRAMTALCCVSPLILLINYCISSFSGGAALGAVRGVDIIFLFLAIIISSINYFRLLDQNEIRKMIDSM